jgi:hypothetical protein
MATQEYAASIQGVSIRVTRLDAAGNLMGGAGNSYTTSSFMRVSFTPEYEEGDEITEKGANGVVCVTYKAPDTLKRITMELAICEPDPELTSLLSGGLLLRKNLGTAGDPNNKSIGWAAPGVGDDPAGNGVAIEVWSHAVKDGKRAGVLPYFHWIFPFAKFRQSGDRVIENGLMANTFEGYGLGNANFKSGLDGRWEFPIAAERPYAYARADWAPTGLNGFYTWTDGSGPVVFTSNSVAASDRSSVTLNSYYATASGTAGNLVFSGSPSISDGDLLSVSNLSPVLNGDHIVTDVSGNTVTFVSSSITADIASSGTPNSVPRAAKVIVVNSADEAVTPVATAVTTLAAGGDTYNVPGNRDYTADAAIDNIIASNENPS